MLAPRVAAALCALAALACGRPDGPYETAGVVTRSSGGDEVISDEGSAAGSSGGPGLAGPIAAGNEYRTALEQAKARRESELSQIDPGGPIHRRLFVEIRAIDEKLQDPDRALLQQRSAFRVAQGALESFFFQNAADREWEIDYAVRSGDIGLAGSIVQDVVRRLERSEPPPDQPPSPPQEEGDLETRVAEPSLQKLASERLRLEVAAADALLKLAQLAIEAADFSEAERQFRACLSYESDLGVRTDALLGYAALLELLGREEEARQMDERAARTITRTTSGERP